MSSKAFVKRQFAFLYGIKDGIAEGKLLPVDLMVGLQLTKHFNEGDQGGRAHPSLEFIAEAIGVGYATVDRSVRRMEKNGRLRIIWGSRGSGHPSSILDAHKGR